MTNTGITLKKEPKFVKKDIRSYQFKIIVPTSEYSNYSVYTNAVKYAINDKKLYLTYAINSYNIKELESYKRSIPFLWISLLNDTGMELFKYNFNIKYHSMIVDNDLYPDQLHITYVFEITTGS
jgi:hypothetical protein